MKKLKIAWFHPHLKYWFGGTKFIFEVAKRLNNKANVDIFVEDVSEKVSNYFLRESNLNIIKFSNLSTYSLKYWFLFPFYFNREILLLKDKFKDYDVIITSMFPANVITDKAKSSQKIIQYIYEPFVFFYDNNFVDKLPALQKYGSKILKFFYKDLDIKATKKADRILTLCETTRNQIKRIFNVDSKITYEGVDTDFFSKKINESLINKYKKYKIIIHSTDFTPIKGTLYVILAMKKIIEKIPNARLLITSTMENKYEEDKLKKLADRLNILKNIEFLGFVDFKKLPEYYSLANVLVHAGISKSSGATTMSLPVKEALACETPVVRSFDTKEEVIDGKSGYLVNPTNQQEMANAIIKILSDSKLEEKMGKYGRAYIIKNFTWEIVTNRFWQTIQSL